MQRKMFVLFAGLVMLSLLIAPVGLVGAQEPPPPTPRPSQPFQPSSNPPSYPPFADELKVGGGIPMQAAPEIGIQALTLGASGLSFSYAQTFGVTEIPYISDTAHLNFPWGIATDGTNVLIGEEWGHRVLKYTNTGTHVSTIGTAGTAYNNGEPWEVFDMAVDGSGQTWVVDNSGRVIKFDASNNFVENFHDDGTFSNPAGIAFDGAGNVYISDGATFWNDDIGNHRVLVFDSAGTLLSTIGTTGVKGTDNTQFFGPQHIAIYGNELYVADGGNNRVQIFVISNPAEPVYSGTIGVTGISGTDSAHFDHPAGVAVNANYIYVADRYNNRVQVFTQTTHAYVTTIGIGWGTGNDQFKNPTDVAVDPVGNLYVADFVNCRVQQFNSSFVHQRTYGVTGVPYLTDDNHYNSPSGVAIAPDGSMYITEDNGHRLIKLNANGSVAWTIGAAGVKGDWDEANDRLNNPADIALNAAGQVYVADRWHGRVQVYNSDGTYAATISGETGNYSFSCPTGLTIDKNGYIYVTDCWRHRVQIFNASHGYVATLGVTDVSGSDNAHFNDPEGVAVDSNGFIYVADSENHRVQVFNASRVYVRTLGVTGIDGDDFAHFASPRRLAVDSSNRLYVSDNWNNRVQVFDSSGAYLTTIGGAWGNQSGRLRSPEGLTIDQSGALYVADSQNHRVQKFTLGTPGWRQSNLNGFGERANRINSLGSFGNQLYAGTYNFGGNGAQLWRSSDGQNWSSILTDGFGDASNVGIDHLAEFNGKLYAGTWNSTNTAPDYTNGGQIWRSDGTTWEQVVNAGFGDPTNGEVMRFAVFNNQIYAGTWSYTNTHGAEIWRSSTGNSGDWTKVVANGLGDATNIGVVTTEIFNGYLYAGTYSSDSVNNRPDGCEVWRTENGTDWTQVVTDGFGNLNCYTVNSLTTFGDSLYAGTGIWDPVTQTYPGGQVWRCTAASGCDTASDWTQVTADGFGNPQNAGIASLRVFGGRLYAVTSNTTTGLEVWRTDNGTNWQQVGFAGFGDSNNRSPYWDNSVTVFNNHLFIGTTNWANGGEIWTIAPTVVSSVRANSNPTAAASVNFTVTFSEPVTDVDASDFALTVTGVTGASITGISGTGPYTITVNTGSGSGTIRLDVPNTATITDLSGIALSGLPFIGGEEYTLARGPIPDPWVGGISIESDQNIVAVARPHVGSQVASYIAPGAGSTEQYVPMLFKDAFGGAYDAALYIQNQGDVSANLSIEFRRDDGTVAYTLTEPLAAKASKGYWLPSIPALGASFVGSAKVTSDQPVLAVGRPHISGEVMTYNGVAAGSTTAWLPMFFKDGYGGSYNTALYVQNLTGNEATLTIEYLNLDGTVACTDNDTLAANASKGYWSLSVACDTGSLPAGFVGGVKVTSTENILTVGRAHLGTQITTYNGFAGGATTAYVPMLFRKAFGGSYNAALYLQNVSGSSADVTIEYLDNAGTVAATQNVTLAAGAITNAWLPSVAGLPDGFVGGARITATQNVIAVGRPHLGSEITAYNGAAAGSLNASLPMLFKNAFGGDYDSAFYIQNVTANAATVNISFYDDAGALSCIKTVSLDSHATTGFWLPSTTCVP